MRRGFSFILIASLFLLPSAWAQRSREARPEARRDRPARPVERRPQNQPAERLRGHFQQQNQELRRAYNAGKITDQEMQVYNRKKAEVQSLYQEINADGVINDREENLLAQNIQELDNLVNRIVHN